MAKNQGTNDVTVTVEFAGICLYVIDGSQPERTVGVLIPTCVPNDRVRTTHEDEDQGARHVPYLLMDLANFDVPDDQKVAAGLDAGGPQFQVVRRLNREELFFQPAQPPGSITLEPDPLPLPDLSLYKNRIGLKDRLFSDLKGPDDRPELNVRTILKGGTLTATTIDGSSTTRGRPSQNPNWDRDPEAWAGSIEWTGRIPGGLTIGIRNWDTGQDTSLMLRPVIRNDTKVIRLKIANLCETNPLEWRQFEHRLQRDDIDFKWLFRLFEPTGAGTLLDAFGGRGHKFPYPKLTPRPARTTGSTGCTGGQFGLP